MTRDLHIRSEQPIDTPAIRELVDQAHGEPKVSALVDRLRESPEWIEGLSFVAEDGSRILGHTLLTRGLLDAPARLVDVLVLSPVSVHPDAQNRGIGSALVKGALKEAEQRSEALVFLEGAPAYYARFGFETAESLGFRRPSLRIPEPAFQVRTLTAYQRWMTGTLVYPRAFWDLDCVGLRA